MLITVPVFVLSCWRSGRRSLRTTWRDLKTKWTVLRPWRRFSLSVKPIGQLWSKWAVSLSAVNPKHTFPCWLYVVCVHYRCWWICTSWRSWRRIASWAGLNRAPPQTRANSSAGIKGCDSIPLNDVTLQTVFTGSQWRVNESTEHGRVVKAKAEELPEQLFLDWTEIWVKEHYFNSAVISCVSTALEVHPMARGGWGVFRRRWMNTIHHVWLFGHSFILFTNQKIKYNLGMFVECSIPDMSAYKGVEVNIYSVFLDLISIWLQCSNRKLVVEMGTAVQIQNGDGTRWNRNEH